MLCLVAIIRPFKPLIPPGALPAPPPLAALAALDAPPRLTPPTTRVELPGRKVSALLGITPRRHPPRKLLPQQLAQQLHNPSTEGSLHHAPHAHEVDRGLAALLDQIDQNLRHRRLIAAARA